LRRRIADQILTAVVEDEFDAQCRVLAGEPGEPREDGAVGESGRGRDAQDPAQFAGASRRWSASSNAAR
jgi:hypothetical protein